jgi:hypothetical protein
VRHLCVGVDQFIEGFEPGQFRSQISEFLNQGFGGDISDESILREGASAQAVDGGIETPASSQVG